MQLLNQTIKSTRQLIAKEVDRKLKMATLVQKENQWRGKKIISTIQWEILKKKRDFQYKLLDYMPEDYVEIPFVWHTQDEKLQNMRSEWCKDYNDFLEHKKSAAFGESKCRSCILHPWHSYCNESLRKVTLKGLDKNYEFPCRTLNMFDCPHGQGKQDSDQILLSLRYVWRIISDALSYTHGMSIKDIFYVITNRKSLDMILEKYIKHVEKMEKDGNGSDAIFESEILREMKKPIIEYFMELKNKVRIDELLNFEGKNLEQEKEDKNSQSVR